MHWIDLVIIVLYLIAMLGVGAFFLRRNKDTDDYYVGGRKMSSFHIGLSVVATDVGGGFSIGLGGLGFIMGLSGSWLLFTGLIGAWLSAVLLIPTVSRLSREHNFLSFPQFLKHSYSRNVAILAGVISSIGYIGFTSSQILAGAKLASATFIDLSLDSALLIMGVIAVVYTVMGGLKAVIYTDTVQWIILLSGLIFIAIPVGYFSLGGLSGIRENLNDPAFLTLTNVTWQQLVNWFLTIVPIWFIGMTLYQRIYAAGDEKTAKKAWFTAGLFEYPVMAFTGVILGMFSKIAFDLDMFQELGFGAGSDLDKEMGLPLFLRTVLPVGFMGIVMAAYFSAIMSTADSCMMAASGNIITDLLGLHESRYNLRISQVLTLTVGALALLLALKMPSVLELMLHSYAFMVSGMLIPVLGAIILKKNRSVHAAVISMITGGSVTLGLTFLDRQLPFGLDPIAFGIAASAIIYAVVQVIYMQRLKPSRA